MSTKGTRDYVMYNERRTTLTDTTENRMVKRMVQWSIPCRPPF